MLTDIEIAQSTELKDIYEIAHELGIEDKDIYAFGRDKAKILPGAGKDKEEKAKLVLVTAINPTSAGEGKTTTSIGLADAMRRIGVKSMLCLREPSLGPVFGVKGGAAGGGYAQVVPMEDINLHFTGDIHAIGCANNLLAAMIDNSIYHGNPLNIDPRRITWRRCMDMNDRQLRFLTDGLGGKANGTPREDGFDITVASEIMAIFCLAKDLEDLKARLGRIICAYTYDGKPVTAHELKADGAMTAILKDAINPNLVQTLEHTPALVHGGPFANIAHGCSSLSATKLGLKLADVVVTEAGFGADLGAEKFLDIKCRIADLAPDAVVLVATVRALKLNGGEDKNNLSVPNVEALKKGVCNLERHIDNLTKVFGMKVCVALNSFPTDTPEEVEVIRDACERHSVPMEISSVFAQGGKGGEALAKKVMELCEKRELLHPYELSDSLKEKIIKVSTKVYRAKSVEFSAEATRMLNNITKMGYGDLPVCIAKTQYSFSDNAKLLGAPEDFTMNIREVRLSAGAGFVVAVSGSIMTMPGLPKVPAAENIDVNEKGAITGLF
ncbi:MAG: formate--tetrahydrofolate ligase [Sphaerochaetaceae bacterium]|nr:formate--tetrahydrofolate ligase [Sphaerochaetaceae bacterium]